MKPNGPLSNVTLIVITLDEEDNIGRCLSSAQGVGEVIVVDSFSDDRTVEIATRYGASVHRREFVSAADQKNWAVSKARLDWILILDADESLSPELREEIAAVVSHSKADGYWLRRRNEFLGRRIRFCGWQNDRVLRLFRRGAGTYPDRAVHEKLELRGRAQTLRAFIDHRPYRDIADYIDRMKSYSTRGALELHRRNRRWFPAIIIRPLARFLRMYLLQLGFLDGMAGFMLCVLASTGVFFKYASLKDLDRRTAGAGEGDA
jgi:glycosyltransferase involved in cell wall biosynthesis